MPPTQVAVEPERCADLRARPVEHQSPDLISRTRSQREPQHSVAGCGKYTLRPWHRHHAHAALGDVACRPAEVETTGDTHSVVEGGKGDVGFHRRRLRTLLT